VVAAIAGIAGLWLLGLMTPAAAQTPWPNTMQARLEALALLETLNADLLSHDSATETLRRWCSDHHLAVGAIVAERVRGADKPIDPALLSALGAGPGELIRYRHVRLACGERVLSEADNWYRPGKLTREMNRVLDETDTPFGVAVKSLGFQRRTLSASLLFTPLPAGWDIGAPVETAGQMTIPAQVIQHRAVLSTPDGDPFSVVVETYTDKVLPDRAP
jgi:chorismate-pyruvate lyase